MATATTLYIIFLIESECEAYLIEPVETSFKALQALHPKNDRIHLINTAITSKSGKARMTIVNPSVASNWQRGISSLREDFHRISGTQTDSTQNIIVNATTFEDLFDQLDLQKIDVLLTDCEGYDLELLKMFPFSTHQPRIIQVEMDTRNVFSPKECGYFIELMISQGYHNFQTFNEDLIAWK